MPKDIAAELLHIKLHRIIFFKINSKASIYESDLYLFSWLMVYIAIPIKSKASVGLGVRVGGFVTIPSSRSAAQGA